MITDWNIVDKRMLTEILKGYYAGDSLYTANTLELYCPTEPSVENHTRYFLTNCIDSTEYMKYNPSVQDLIATITKQFSDTYGVSENECLQAFKESKKGLLNFISLKTKTENKILKKLMKEFNVSSEELDMMRGFAKTVKSEKLNNFAQMMENTEVFSEKDPFETWAKTNKEALDNYIMADLLCDPGNSQVRFLPLSNNEVSTIDFFMSTILDMSSAGLTGFWMWKENGEVVFDQNRIGELPKNCKHYFKIRSISNDSFKKMMDDVLKNNLEEFPEIK